MPKRIVIIAILVFVCLLLYAGSRFLINKLCPSSKYSNSDEDLITAMAFEWPQFHGPNRDNCSAETGLLKIWPGSGPKLLWKCDGIGIGWSSPSLASGNIFVTGAEDEKEFLTCLNLSGILKWKVYYGTAHKMYSGTRSSPTIDDGFAYVISGTGEVVCIDIKKRMIEWKINGYKLFEGKCHNFGIAESPLIFGNKVFYTPCGERTAMAALDKRTGQIIWESESLHEQSAYVSPIIIRRGTQDIIVTVTAMYIIGIDPQTGDVIWKYPYVENHKTKSKVNTLIQNAVMPVYKDGQLYVTSGYDHVGIALKLSEDGRQISLLWEDKTLDCHHGGVILHDGYIYGSNWHNNLNGNWICLDWKTGQVMYDHKWIGKGSILCADGMLYCYEEREGNIALVTPSPKGFDIISSFKITKGTGEHWAHPVICDGRLYIRRGDSLMAYDIKQKKKEN
ncbi:MAG: PQQ-like beta-propeller repeat protein [Sedimentisphaerales bacterium]|nr:PQQ-like beta-propeller repeat protein [Sedimentisphaerales bacterium]